MPKPSPQNVALRSGTFARERRRFRRELNAFLKAAPVINSRFYCEDWSCLRCGTGPAPLTVEKGARAHET